VFAEDEARLLVAAAQTPSEVEASVARRVAGEPLEHVLGWAEFCGLRVSVEPGVFVPRRRTEFLVHEAARLARPGAVIVDLCCGTGALGVALAASVDHAELHAVDIDPVAVRCARRNVPGTVYHGDLFEPLPSTLRGRVDMLLANVPYVPTREIVLLPAEARLHEDRVALDGGPDGLSVLRRMAADAPHWLAPGAHLLVETSAAQAPQALAAFPPLAAQIAHSDEYEATVVIGTKH
jgi:release factor glutamine methyltransferase